MLASSAYRDFNAFLSRSMFGGVGATKKSRSACGAHETLGSHRHGTDQDILDLLAPERGQDSLGFGEVHHRDARILAPPDGQTKHIVA